MTPGDQIIQCDVCQATFTRQEHLNRHARSHTTEKPFHCSTCGKRFARLDVLHRHSQSHAPKTTPTDGSSRACKECAVSRVRCPRGNPCERCQQRELQCVYPMARKRKVDPAPTPRGPALPLPATGFSLGLSDQSREGESRISPSGPEVQAVGNLSATIHHVDGSRWFPLDAPLDAPALLEDNPELIPEINTALNNQMLDKDFSEWVRSMPSVNWLSPQGPDTFFSDTSLDGLLPPESNNVDIGVTLNGDGLHLGLGRPSFEPNIDTSLYPNGAQPASGTPPSESGMSTRDSLASQSVKGTYYVEGSVGRAPFQGRSGWRRRRPFWLATSNAFAGDQTPTSGGSPAMLQNTFLSETVYENMLRHLQAECETSNLALDLAQFPSLGEMQELVQVYFEGFHTTYPFLRRHPYQFTPEGSWILLLSVAAAGCPYTHTARYQRIGAYLAHIVDVILTNRIDAGLSENEDQPWSPALKPHIPWDLVTLQAGVLNCLYLLHSGNRGSASNHLKLLSAIEPQVPEAGEESSQPGLIECWVNMESRRRTGWMIWLLDSIVHYEFNCSPLMPNGAVGALLPCKEDIWDRPSPSPLSSGKMNKLVTFLPPNLGDLSTTVLIFAILQRTREAAIQHQTELTFWSPNAKKQPRLQTRAPAEKSWPPAIPALSNIAARAGGWEHPAIFHLHTARLLLLAPICHIQQLAAVPSANTSRGSESIGSSTARNHVFQWAIRDQYKARLSVIHAGALLWHIRRYSSNSFLEPFAVYTATLSVGGKSGRDNVVLDGQLPSGNTIIPQGGQRSLDASEPLDSDESQGETEPTVIQLDRPCDDEIVQAYVCLGHKMSARMSRVGDILGSSAPARILKQGIRRRMLSNTGGDSEGAFPGWCAEQSFASSLRALASVATGETPEGRSANHPR
ncbi:hypothetical protein BJX62DRAFT_229210 [Aspergillus germanicus]